MDVDAGGFVSLVVRGQESSLLTASVLSVASTVRSSDGRRNVKEFWKENSSCLYLESAYFAPIFALKSSYALI